MAVLRWLRRRRVRWLRIRNELRRRLERRRARYTLRRIDPVTDYYGTHGNPDPGHAGWGDVGAGLLFSVDGSDVEQDWKEFQVGPPLLGELPDPTTAPPETAGTVFGGYRRSLGNHAQDSNDVIPPGPNPGYRYRIEMTDMFVRSEFPVNAGNGWGTLPDEETGPDGTTWGQRTHGISEGLFLRLDTRLIYGKAFAEDPTIWGTNEGHAMYHTISPEAGKTIALTDCDSVDCGGHAYYFTTAYDGSQRWPTLNRFRAGRALQPELGGFLNFTRCTAINTDTSEGRGAFAFNFPDTFSTITLDACTLVQNITGGYRKGATFFDSRAALSAVGVCGGVRLINGCSFTCQSAPMGSDRTYQISVRGPDFLELIDSHFDMQRISVNNTFHLSPYDKLTNRLTISNCTGTADVFFNDIFLGKIDELNDTWYQPFRRPLYIPQP